MLLRQWCSVEVFSGRWINWRGQRSKRNQTCICELRAITTNPSRNHQTTPKYPLRASEGRHIMFYRLNCLAAALALSVSVMRYSGWMRLSS